MATEEWVKRAIENSKTYEELPQRVRTLLPVTEWKSKYSIPLSDRLVSRTRQSPDRCLYVA